MRSLKHNLEDLQTQLIDELGFPFSIIAVTETKITNEGGLNFNPKIPNYEFEYVPTPLSAGGVGIYITGSFNYTILEKTSNDSFQAIWIKIHCNDMKDKICGVIYRQHNCPERFLSYFEDTIEKLSSHDNPIYVMGDFNIDLLKSESCNHAQKLLLSLQSYHLIPTIDKPTRVYKNSATLIDNIFVNNITNNVLSGNVVSDISDHFSQFCILHSYCGNNQPRKQKFRDYSNFSEKKFNDELSNVAWDFTSPDIDKCFSTFYNKLNKIVNKHAPLKTVTKRMEKQFSKPWITSAIKRSIRIKNSLYHNGNMSKYKYYRNKLTVLIRTSKQMYYHSYFNSNIKNMKMTWRGINDLINSKKKCSKSINALKRQDRRETTRDSSEISNIIN